MVVVHRGFRRMLNDAPRLVREVRRGDTARASVVAEHITEMHTALHRHQSGEDELLWPLLRARVTDLGVVVRMEEQHTRVSLLLERAAGELPGFAGTGEGAPLAETLEHLAAA